MNLRRREAGQTATEYLGMIVVVAAIIGAVMATDVGAKISGGLQDAICRITGGSCESAADDVANAGETPVINTNEDGGGGTPEGPEFGDGEFPVGDVPWDGSVSVNGNSTDGGGLYLDATITESETACTLDADGAPVVNLDVAGNLKAGAKADSIGKDGTGVGIDGYVGNGISYGISTDPDTADDLQDDTLPTPSPVNPLTIPEGTALTLTESSYAGLDLTGAYRGLQATLGYERGTEVSSAVERVDQDTVRVTVGDADYVQQGLGLGLGVASAGVDRTSSVAKAKQVDIDVSTPAGQQAYADFIETGKLPGSGSGVSGTTDIASTELDGSLHAGFDLGPFEGTVDSNQTGSATSVTHPDGSKSYTSYTGGQDITKAITWTEDAAGDEIQAPTTQVRYGDLSPNEAASVAYAYTGVDNDYDDADGDQDLTVTLTEDDIAQLQEQARIAADQSDADGSRDMELENLATVAPGNVGDVLQASPESLLRLLGGVRMGVVEAGGGRDGFDEDDVAGILPDVDPTAAPAGCS